MTLRRTKKHFFLLLAFTDSLASHFFLFIDHQWFFPILNTWPLTKTMEWDTTLCKRTTKLKKISSEKNWKCPVQCYERGIVFYWHPQVFFQNQILSYKGVIWQIYVILCSTPPSFCYKYLINPFSPLNLYIFVYGCVFFSLFCFPSWLFFSPCFLLHTWRVSVIRLK